MKNIAWLPVALTAVVLSAATAGGLPRNLRSDIDRGNASWVKGLEAGDATTAVSAFADDAVNCAPDGTCVRGRDAIAAQYAALITKAGHATGGSVRSETLQVDKDLAYETGYAEARFADGSARRGRFSTVWKLQSDGHWKIFRNMSLPPAP